VTTASAPSVDFVDDFATDSSSDYVQLNAVDSVIYDSENQRMKGSNISGLQGVYHDTEFSGEYYVTADIKYTTTISTTGALVANCNGNGTESTGFTFQLGPDNVIVKKFTGGIKSGSLSSVSQLNYSGGKVLTNNTAYQMRVDVEGSLMTVYVDFNDDGDFADADETVGTVTNASYSGGYGGFYFYANVSWVDNFGMGGL
jgi:hypothetical protein